MGESIAAEELEVQEAQEESYKSGSVQYIDSREVAEMVGKSHNELLKDIRRYCKQLSLGKISQSDFFIESIYKTDRGKEYPCYNVTKKAANL